ncbi:MAG: Do family serine endopeptidase [Brevinematia bacterium]
MKVRRFFSKLMLNWFVLNLVLTGFLVGVIFSFGVLGGSCSYTKDRGNVSFASSSGVDLSKLPEEYRYAYSVQRVLNDVAEKVSPAVVNIKSESVVEYTYRDPFYEFFRDDEFLRKFFDVPDFFKERKYKRTIPSLGSGFIISRDGYILSNLHVVRPGGKMAKDIIVTVLKSGKEYKAKVVGYDEATDIAVLKIEPKEELPVVTLGDSDKVRVGDFAIAIGNPFGLNGTFTFGTISAVNRDIQGIVFSKYIQTDAPINPGNSGGPLVNLFGEVIGINTFIVSTSQMGTGGNIGIGFAIPINTAKKVVKQLVEKGRVERGYLGVTVLNLDSETRKQMGLPEDLGVLVSMVEPNSPADKAGIKQGDVITEVDGERITSSDALVNKIASKSPGEVAKVRVFRDNKYLEFSIKVGLRPSEEELAKKFESGEEGYRGNQYEYRGVVVVSNPNGNGVVVVTVKEDSVFSGILQKGDIIVEINGKRIYTLSDFQDFAKANKDAKKFLVKFYRDNMLMIRGFSVK